MNPAALQDYAEYLQREMGTGGDFELMGGLRALDFIAPWWPEGSRISLSRRGYNGVLFANNPRFPKSQRMPNRNMKVEYSHRAMLTFFVAGQDRLPHEGDLYLVPAVVEYLSKTYDGTAHEVMSIDVGDSNIYPIQTEQLKCLAIAVPLTVIGQFTVTPGMKAMRARDVDFRVAIRPTGTNTGSGARVEAGSSGSSPREASGPFSDVTSSGSGQSEAPYSVKDGLEVTGTGTGSTSPAESVSTLRVGVTGTGSPDDSSPSVEVEVVGVGEDSVSSSVKTGASGVGSDSQTPSQSVSSPAGGFVSGSGQAEDDRFSIDVQVATAPGATSHGGPRRIGIEIIDSGKPDEEE